MKKSPLLAAFLNLFTFGGGYIYNGRRIPMGLLLIVAVILIRCGEIPIYLTGLVFSKWLIMFIGIVVLQITFAIDAFKEAQMINSMTNTK